MDFDILRLRSFALGVRVICRETVRSSKSGHDKICLLSPKLGSKSVRKDILVTLTPIGHGNICVPVKDTVQ